MSILLQQDDFSGSTGSLAAPWSLIAGAWTRDGTRVAPTSAPGTLSHARLSAFDPGSLLSISSNPPTMTYEADVTLPTTFPATGDISQGITFLNSSTGTYGFELRYERLTAGTHQILFVMRGLTASTLLYGVYAPTSFTALAAGGTATLKAEIRFQVSNIYVIGYLDGVTLFFSTPSYAAMNAAFGTSYGSISAIAKYGGLVGSIAGTAGSGGGPAFPGYFDRWRVRDIGSLTTIPSSYSTPTLTAAPTLSAITVGAENDAGAETIPVNPSYAMQVSDGWAIDSIRSDGGHTVAMARQTRPRRTWQMHWDALTSANLTSFETLWAATTGTKKACTWTDPETGDAIVGRFTTEPRVSRVAPAIYQATCEWQEVF